MRTARTLRDRGPGLIALAAVAVLGTALASQYWGGLSPCKLCWYQRVPYAFAITAATLGAILAARGANRGAALLVFVCGVGFVLGAAVAAFHVGVEQGWWEGSTACIGVGVGAATTVDELRRMLEAAPIVRCDEVQWSLGGVSMAGYNFLVSMALAAFAALTAKRLAEQ